MARIFGKFALVGVVLAAVAAFGAPQTPTDQQLSGARGGEPSCNMLRMKECYRHSCPGVCNSTHIGLCTKRGATGTDICMGAKFGNPCGSIHPDCSGFVYGSATRDECPPGS